MNLILLLGDAGLGTLQTNLITNWIGPAFFLVVAGFAIKFLISRQFRELASFLGIAAVVALFVFNASGLFGTEGIFSSIANSFAGALKSGGGSSGAGQMSPGGIIEILKYLTI